MVNNIADNHEQCGQPVFINLNKLKIFYFVGSPHKFQRGIVKYLGLLRLL